MSVIELDVAKLLKLVTAGSSPKKTQKKSVRWISDSEDDDKPPIPIKQYEPTTQPVWDQTVVLSVYVSVSHCELSHLICINNQAWSGPGWSNNSCWLDSVLQVLYAAVTFSGGTFQSLLDFHEQHGDSPIGALSAYLINRYKLVASAHPGSQLGQALTKQRDELRVLLQKLIGRSPGEYTTLFQGLMVGLRLSINQTT